MVVALGVLSGYQRRFRPLKARVRKHTPSETPASSTLARLFTYSETKDASVTFEPPAQATTYGPAPSPLRSRAMET